MTQTHAVPIVGLMISLDTATLATIHAPLSAGATPDWLELYQECTTIQHLPWAARAEVLELIPCQYGDTQDTLVVTITQGTKFLPEFLTVWPMYRKLPFGTIAFFWLSHLQERGFSLGIQARKNYFVRSKDPILATILGPHVREGEVEAIPSGSILHVITLTEPRAPETLNTLIFNYHWTQGGPVPATAYELQVTPDLVLQPAPQKGGK